MRASTHAASRRAWSRLLTENSHRRCASSKVNIAGRAVSQLRNDRLPETIKAAWKKICWEATATVRVRGRGSSHDIARADLQQVGARGIRFGNISVCTACGARLRASKKRTREMSKEGSGNRPRSTAVELRRALQDTLRKYSQNLPEQRFRRVCYILEFSFVLNPNGGFQEKAQISPRRATSPKVRRTSEMFHIPSTSVQRFQGTHGYTIRASFA